MVEEKNHKFFYGYLIILAAFGITLVSNGTNGTFGIFLKPLLTEFGWTRAMASGAQSIRGLESGIFSIASGWLNDKFGPRRVVTAAGLFIGLGLLLTSQTSTIWQLYLFYGVLSAIGGGSLMVPLTSTIARWFGKRRGLMTGIIMSGGSTGSMIFPPAVTWLILTYGWRNSYIILGIMSLVFIILGAQFLLRDPAQRGQLPYGAGDASGGKLDSAAGGSSFQEAIHTRQFWIFCAINFLLIFSLTTVMTHVVIHAIGLGISAIRAASILTFMGGAGIGGRLIGGSVGDKIGNRKALIISLTLFSVSLFWLAVARDLWMFYLFALIYGLGWAGSGVQMSPLIAELFGLRSHGIIFGSGFSVGTIGGAIGGVLAGHIFDVTGSYQPAFLASATLAVIALLLAWLLRPIDREEKLDEHTGHT